MAAPEPSRDELRQLRADLLHGATRGRLYVPSADAEDVTQQALMKVVREPPHDDAPPLIVRGRAALKRAKVDYLRKRTRVSEPVVQPLETAADIGAIDARILLVELEETLRREVGPDALEYAKARQDGLTEKDLAQQLGWTPQRAGAARKRLSRAIDVMRAELLDD